MEQRVADLASAGRSTATRLAVVLLGAIMLVTPPLRLARAQPTPRPPSSIEPKLAKQKILVSYAHRRVVACLSVPLERPTACVPRMTDAVASTALFFEQIATAAGGPSRRQVVVRFPATAGVQKRTAELAVGEWLLDWPGCGDVRHLSLTQARDVAPRVALRATSGACELTTRGCRLLDDASEQQLSIDE
jgi:hypothetical protein